METETVDLVKITNKVFYEMENNPEYNNQSGENFVLALIHSTIKHTLSEVGEVYVGSEKFN